MNSNLFIAGLLVFSCLPNFAQAESGNLVKVDRSALSLVNGDKLQILADAKILTLDANTVVIDIGALNALTVKRLKDGRATRLAPEIQDLISNVGRASVPYGNT